MSRSPFARLLRDPDARKLSRVGVVDVGSNSIRLVVFDGAARSPAYFYNEKVMAGLGQGLATSGRLNPQGVTRAIAALRRFAVLAEGMDLAPLTCVATAAVREAADGPAFRKQVEDETGLHLIVIDGEDEARLSAQGVLLGWPDAKGLVCDIGGSSMELAEVEAGKIGQRATSPLGPFRLQQVEGGQAGMTAHIDAIMADLVSQFGTDHERIYLVGGSWRAIARIDMARRDYPMTVLHEYRMTPEDAAATVDYIAGNDVARLRKRAGLSSLRAELVPLASQVLQHMVAVGPEVARIRAAAGLPVIVGFGISTPEAARAVCAVADGCVVGSAIVKLIGEGRPVADVLDFVASLAQGAHGAAVTPQQG